ncbi:hypothetical protein Bca101_010426 [Brassica carinata]
MADNLRRAIQDLNLGIDDAPTKQNLRVMMTSLPKMCGLVGLVSGRIVDRRNFQFVFPSKEMLPSIRGIPLEYLSEPVIRNIGDRMGEVMLVDFNPGVNAAFDFVRVCLNCNVAHPLKFQRNFQFTPAVKTLLKFRYERLKVDQTEGDNEEEEPHDGEEEAEEDGDNQEVEALVEPAASVAAAPMNQEMEVRKEYERRIGEARIKRRNDFVDALLEESEVVDKFPVGIMKVSSEFSALRKLQDDYGHDHVREETSQIDIGERWILILNGTRMYPRQRIEVQENRSSKWERPPSEWVKCNFDYSPGTDSTGVGIAWLLRDEKGRFLGAGCARVDKTQSSLEGEAISFLFALLQGTSKRNHRISVRFPTVAASGDRRTTGLHRFPSFFAVPSLSLLRRPCFSAVRGSRVSGSQIWSTKKQIWVCGGCGRLRTASTSTVSNLSPSCSLLVSVVSGVASVCCASGRVLCLSAFSVVLSPCSLVVAACGASSVAEASVRLSVFPGGSALVLELLRYGSSGILGALVGQRVSEFGYGFVSSGGLSVYRSVFSIWVAVRWVYTVTVECNGGGNLRCNPLNDGIVGLRLLLVPPGASFISPVWVCARILRLGVLCVAVGSCRNCSIQGLRAPFSR